MLTDLLSLLVCPACCRPLEFADSARCRDCSTAYTVENGIPVLIANGGNGEKRRQAAWFDGETDPRWEMARPSGAPPLHRYLLEKKFRHGTAGVGGLIPLRQLSSSGRGSAMDGEFLAREVPAQFPWDISFGAARRARERALRHKVSIDVTGADMERLPFSGRSIEVVSVQDGLHHLERPQDCLAEKGIAESPLEVQRRSFGTRIRARFRAAGRHPQQGGVV